MGDNIMGRIFESLQVWGNKDGKQIEKVLFDCGASHSVLREDVSKDICDIVPFKDKDGKNIKRELTLADGKSKITALGACTFSTIVRDRDITDTAWVVDTLSQEMIIGADTMQRYKMELKYAEKKKGGDDIILEPMEDIDWV